MGGAGHIPKNTARKEDRVGEVNFFRASTKPQTCGTSLGTAVAWGGWKSRWPWRPVLSLGCLEGIRCHQNAQEVSHALSKVCQPQAGAVCSRVVLHISCSSSLEETHPGFVPSGVLF